LANKRITQTLVPIVPFFIEDDYRDWDAIVDWGDGSI